jgi:hypothetical protein
MRMRCPTVRRLCLNAAKIIGCATAFVAVPSGEQGQSAAATPDLRPLERYIGRWAYEGEDKTAGTGGRVTCRSTRRWISGGFYVESHRTCSTPRGTFDQVEIFGYDAERRQYVYWGFSGRIVSTYATEAIVSTSVTWVGFGASAGNRCTEVFSADGRSSTDTCETSIGGSAPIVRASGTSSKLE